MAVLVDTSVWIDFRVGSKSIELDDLIIAQNTKENRCEVFSFDKRFQVLSQIINIKLYQPQI